MCILMSNATFAQAQTTTGDTPSITADTFDIRSASFLLPQRLPKGKYSYSLSLQYVAPPATWTLDNITVPMFNYTAKYTLGNGFNLQGGVSTLIISNRFNAGPFWNYVKDHFHLGLGYQVAFNFGMLRHFGFNSTLTGWEQQPSVTLGYSFKKTAVTLRSDLYYTTDMRLHEGGSEIRYNENFINGFSVTSSFEQRLHKNRVMSLGVRINYLRYHILAWPALPVNSYYYVFPEFHLGLNF
jgi:hypothetical protein